MYGQCDIYGACGAPEDTEDSFGILLEGLRTGIKDRQIAYILGKLKEMYEKGRMDKAQKKAQRLGEVVDRYQELDPGYVPDAEVLAWIAYGNGEVGDPNDYFEAEVTTGVTSSLFEEVDPSLDVGISMSMGGPRRYMPYKRSMPYRAGPRPGASRRGGPPRRRPSRPGPVHGPTPRMGGLFDGPLDEGYGGLFQKSLEHDMKYIKRQYEKDLKQGDMEGATARLAQYEELLQVWQEVQGMPDVSLSARVAEPAILR